MSEPIMLNLSPHEVSRALEALRGSRGYVALMVADKLEAAAPEHMRILRELETPEPLSESAGAPYSASDAIPGVVGPDGDGEGP